MRNEDETNKIGTLAVLLLLSFSAQAQSNLNNKENDVQTIDGAWCNGNSRFLGSTTELIEAGYSCNSSLTECVFVTEKQEHIMVLDNVADALVPEFTYFKRTQVYFIEGDALFAKTISSREDNDGLAEDEKISPAYYRCE